MTFQKRIFAALALALLACRTQAEDAKTALNFQEVFGLISSNLAGFPPAEVEKAAATGLINELGGRVELVRVGGPATNAAPLLARTNVYEGGYGYFRVARVGEGLAKQFSEAYDGLRSSNKLKGILLDLRFASGQDYKAASELADRFLSQETTLLKWGDTTLRSTAKSDAIRLPVAVLINQKTSGAAEALAGALRQSEAALLIGNPTAGKALVFQTFPLSTGQELRIGKVPVELGNGQTIPAKGLSPDILVTVNPLDEAGYFEDAYKVFAKTSEPLAQVSRTNAATNLTGSARARRSFNEAELVRRHREGLDLESEMAGAAEDPAKPLVTDPALARGLDFLKGLAVALQFRSP